MLEFLSLVLGAVAATLFDLVWLIGLVGWLIWLVG